MQRNVFQHNLAVALFQIGEMSEAETLLGDAVRHFGEAGEAGRLAPWPLVHYGYVALYEAHLDSARKYLAILAKQGAAEHDVYWEGRGLFGLVQAEARLGRLADARRTAAQFRSISDDPRLTDTDDQLIDYRLVEAWLAYAAGDPATAYAKVTEVMRANGFFDGKRRRLFHTSLMLGAESALAIGKPNEALVFVRGAGANAMRDSLSETQSAFLAEARLLEGRALLAAGDTAAARATVERSLAGLRSGAGVDHPRTGEAEALLRALSR